jgi:hypothetical protein
VITGRRERVERAHVVLVIRAATVIAFGLVLGAAAARAAETKPADAKPAAAADAKPSKRSRKEGAKAAKDGRDKKALPAARLDARPRRSGGEDDAAAIAAARRWARRAARERRRAAGRVAGGRDVAGARGSGAGRARQAGRRGALTAPRALEVAGPYCGHRAPRFASARSRRWGRSRTRAWCRRCSPAWATSRRACGPPRARRWPRDKNGGDAALFALVKRGDAGAASPLAALATPDLIPQIAELAGTVDDAVLATALGDYAQRSDVPDRQRLDVVRTIAKLSGAGATTALVEYVASVPAKEERPSKREAQKLLDQRESAQ